MPSRPATIFKVYINGAERPDVRPLMIQRSAGGHHLDSATLVNDPKIGEPYLRNLSIGGGTNSEVVITATTPDGVTQQVFWGKITRAQVEIHPGNAGEHLLSTARVEDFHFGDPLVGKYVYDDPAQNFLFIDCQQIIFNPIHEGKVHFNRRADDFLRENLYPVFIEVEALPADEVEQDEESNGEEWTLAQAVYYCCTYCNQLEGYIKNPTFAELDGLFTAADKVRHLPLRNGLHLPKVLDALLEPFGYQWCIQFANNGTRKIGIWKRGVGVATMPVRLQDPIAAFDPLQTNMAECNITFDASAAYNEVRGLGSFIEFESTFTLIRAWPANKDALKDTPDQLERSYLKTHPENRDVWRKWVLNEAGDYKGVRQGAGYDHPYLFPGMTDEADQDIEADSSFCSRRRRFLPTITTDDGGNPIGLVQGCRVEYYNGNTGATNGWTDVTNEVRILHKECGVKFTGTHAPQEIMRHGDSAKIRVTATIRLDARVQRVAARQNGSPLADTQELVLDLHDRFHWRYIAKDSQYKSQVDAGTLLANTVDDRDALAEYCEEIRRAWDQASVSGPITLEGCDHLNYLIGMAVSGIVGRNISFRSRTDNARYPTIVGVTLDVQNQKTHLHLDHFRMAQLLRFATDRQGIEGTA